MSDPVPLIHSIRARLQQATGREYQIKLESLDVQSLRELLRAVQDLDHEKIIAAKKGASSIDYWRRP
jgi:hypothetical protein